MTQPEKPNKATTTVTVKSKAKPPVDLTPKNPEQIKKAVAIGKELVKQMATNPDITKASIARDMFPLLQDERNHSAGIRRWHRSNAERCDDVCL